MKSNLVAIYSAIDIVSAGLLSTIKSNISNAYKGYFEEKFNRIMEELVKNDISENEILKFINNLNQYDKDILFAIINKNLQSDNKIKSFLLSKILFYKFTNTNLDYFHANILTNLDLFVVEDFENFKIIYNFYEINNIGSQPFAIKVLVDNFSGESYNVTIVKMKSIGLLLNTEYAQEWSESGYLYLGKGDGFENLGKYINEYYN